MRLVKGANDNHLSSTMDAGPGVSPHDTVSISAEEYERLVGHALPRSRLSQPIRYLLLDGFWLLIFLQLRDSAELSENIQLMMSFELCARQTNEPRLVD